jgi:hypothetical protein
VGATICSARSLDETLKAERSTTAVDLPPLDRRRDDEPGVRRLRKQDIPGLCDLFAAAFRSGSKIRRDAVALAFERTYLTSPGDRLQPASLVEVGADGSIDAFMGIITLSARLGDQPLRVGILGNFMARDSNRAKAAVRLARATTSEDFDLVFTDTANQISLGICHALKYATLPLHSLEWVKILRPFETGTFLVGRRVPKLGRFLAPIARVLDRGGRRLAFAALPPPERGKVKDVAISPLEFADAAFALVERFRFHPDWSERAELLWLLEQAARKTRNGPLHLRKVVDAHGKTLGLYLLYARAGAAAHALQILSIRNHETAVLGALIKTAAAIGAVAVRGSANPHVLGGLIRQRGIFYHHVAAAMSFARRPEIADAVSGHDSIIGGLLGETWTQLSTEDFR